MTCVLQEITPVTNHKPHTCLYSAEAQHQRSLDGTTHCIYPRRDGHAELTSVVGQTEINFPNRELNPDMVTHPSTNWAWHNATLCSEQEALLLQHTY